MHVINESMVLLQCELFVICLCGYPNVVGEILWQYSMTVGQQNEIKVLVWW